MTGYSQQIWNDDDFHYPVSAARMQHIEQAIYDLKHGAWAVQDPAESMTITPASGQSVATLKVADGVITGTEQASMAGTMWNPPVNNQRSALSLTLSGKGIGATGEGGIGLRVLMQDQGTVVNKAITGAVNNGSGLIRITCTGHTFATGDRIAVYAVGGATQANGAWTITVIDANTFDLQGSTFSSAYTSGGYATSRPYGIGVWSTVSPKLSRGIDSTGTTGQLSGTAASGDDLNAFVASNISGASGFKATDAFYVSAGGPTVGAAWDHGFACDAKLYQSAFQFTADLTGPTTEGLNSSMIDLGKATASGGGYAIRLPNSVVVAARNGANSADSPLFVFTASNRLQFQATLELGDGVNVAIGSSTGSFIGVSNSKLAFYGATAIVRPAGWAAATNTKTRTTFDTTTVTLPVLAAHVGALMDDLIALGLIGT